MPVTAQTLNGQAFHPQVNQAAVLSQIVDDVLAAMPYDFTEIYDDVRRDVEGMVAPLVAHALATGSSPEVAKQAALAMVAPVAEQARRKAEREQDVREAAVQRAAGGGFSWLVKKVVRVDMQKAMRLPTQLTQQQLEQVRARLPELFAAPDGQIEGMQFVQVEDEWFIRVTVDDKGNTVDLRADEIRLIDIQQRNDGGWTVIEQRAPRLEFANPSQGSNAAPTASLSFTRREIVLSEAQVQAWLALNEAYAEMLREQNEQMLLELLDLYGEAFDQLLVEEGAEQAREEVAQPLEAEQFLPLSGITPAQLDAADASPADVLCPDKDLPSCSIGAVVEK